MKKLISLIVLLSIFNSCSEETEIVNEVMLIKKLTETYTDPSSNVPNETVVVVNDFSYDGNKIISITETVESVTSCYSIRKDFTYDGDLISKILIEDSEYPDEFEEYIFTYDDYNNIVLVEEKDWSTNVITYDGNKALIKVELEEGVFAVPECYETIFENNNILTQKTNNDEMGLLLGGDPCDFNETTYTTYDSRTNPFSNITGVNWYISELMILTNSMYPATTNNPVSMKSTSGVELTFSYSFNENDYPQNISVYHSFYNIDFSIDIEY